MNGSCVTALPALPDTLKEMAVGFLICEGLVHSFGDIASVRMENGSLVCETRDGKAAPHLAQKMGMTLVGFARNPNLYVYAGEERIA